MKFGAHPLVVAVALGLLAPGALATEDESDERAPAASLTEDDEPLDSLLAAPAPEAEEYARVADEWREARQLL